MDPALVALALAVAAYIGIWRLSVVDRRRAAERRERNRGTSLAEAMEKSIRNSCRCSCNRRHG